MHNPGSILIPPKLQKLTRAEVIVFQLRAMSGLAEKRRTAAPRTVGGLIEDYHTLTFQLIGAGWGEEVRGGLWLMLFAGVAYKGHGDVGGVV